MENKNEENVFSPKGFFMKLEWYELFAAMKPKQFQNVILNSYNYLLGNELLGMNQFESTIFEYAIKPVLVHNNKVYQEKCAHNARISKKGVEAKAAKKLKDETDTTQNNPLGKTTNPELPKDKSITKEKDINNILAGIAEKVLAHEKTKRERITGGTKKHVNRAHHHKKNTRRQR